MLFKHLQVKASLVSLVTSLPAGASQDVSRRRPLVSWWRSIAAQRAQSSALRSAYAAHGAVHNHLHEELFDLHFLRGRGARAVAEGDAEALARAWTAQFRYSDEKRRALDVRWLLPVAESFLGFYGEHRAALARSSEDDA